MSTAKERVRQTVARINTSVEQAAPQPSTAKERVARTVNALNAVRAAQKVNTPEVQVAQPEMPQSRQSSGASGITAKPVQSLAEGARERAYDRAIAANESKPKAAQSLAEAVRDRHVPATTPKSKYGTVKTAEQLRREHEIYITLRDQAKAEAARYAKAAGDLGLVNAWATPDDPQRDVLANAQKNAEKAQKNYEHYKDMVGQTAAQYYHRENQEQQDKLRADGQSALLYRSVTEKKSDIDKAVAVADYAINGAAAQDPAQVDEYKKHLFDTYGLTEDAIRDYAIRGADHSTPEGGYTNIYQLIDQLEREVTGETKKLGDSGFNYRRMSGYQQMLEDKAEYEKKRAQWEQAAKDDPILASIGTVAVAPLQGLDAVGSWISGIGQSDEENLDSYVPANVYKMDAVNAVQTVRGTVSKEIEQNTNWELFGHNVASFLYQTGMSVADSATQVYTLGPAATYVMGFSSAANQSHDIIERGGTNRQAFWGGLAAGAAECIFEKVSIDNLLKPKEITGWKSLFKETMKQAGVEASEEMATEIANILSDAAIMGERSEFNSAVKQYMTGKDRLTEEAAKKKAFLDCVGQVAWAGAGGAISGGVMGGAQGLFTRSQMAKAEAKASYTDPLIADIRAKGQGQADTGVMPAQADTTIPGTKNAVEGAKNASMREAGLNPVSKEMQESLSTGKNNFIAKTLGDIVDFAKRALQKKGSPERLYMGTLPDATAEFIRQQTGVDVSGYQTILPGDSIQHIHKHHGDPVMEGARGQRAVSAEDIGLIPQVLAAPDSVTVAEDADALGRTVLFFSKQIGDTYVTAQAVTDGRHALTTSSLWIKRGKPTDTTHNASASADPVPNAQSVPPSGIPMNSIPQSSQDVNPSGGNMPNGVGAAERGFTTPGTTPTTRVSNLADDAMVYNRYRGEAAMVDSGAEWRESFRYEVESREQRTQYAYEQLFAEIDGERTFIRDFDPAGYEACIRELTDAPAWNGVMTEMAKLIEQEILRRSLLGGDATTEEYRQWRDTMREKATETGRGVNAWKGEGNNNGQDTETRAWDNLQNSDLTEDEKAQRFSAIVKFDQRIEAAQTTEALQSVILEIAAERGTTNGLNKKQSNRLLRRASSALSGMEFGELKQFAYASSAALSQDVVPTNIGQKLKTIQVLNMLSNPKTAVKNLTGNGSFYLLDSLALDGAALIDMAVAKATGTRSVAATRVFSAETWNGIKKSFSRSIAEITMDVDMGSGNRYSGGRRTFHADGNVVERAMSVLERNMGYLLTSSDEAFKGAARSTAAATQRLIDEGKIKTNDQNYAKNQAEELARYRTFQKDGGVTAFLLQQVHDVLNLGVLGVGKSGKKMGRFNVKNFGVGDLTAPFTRVAANLVEVGVDYSPVNLIKGTVEIVETIAARANGVDPVNQAKGVRDLSRGLTGTMIAMGFRLLAKAGCLRRANDEDDEEIAALNRSEGMVGTQINLSAAQRWVAGGFKPVEWELGDTLVDLSNLEPINMIVDLGAELAKIDTEDGILSTVGGVVSAHKDSFFHAVEDLPIMSTVSGFAKDVFQYKKDPAQSAIQALGKTAISSATPNVLAAVAKGLDDKQRNAYASDKDGWAETGDVLLDTLKSRIPGLRQTLPTKVDVVGKEKENAGNVAQRLLNAMFNPIGVNEYTQSDVSRELERVRGETGETGFYPSKKIPSKVTYTDKQGIKHEAALTYAQRQEYQKVRAASHIVAMTNMVGTSMYKKANATTQAALLERCHDYAGQVATASVLGSDAAEAWVRNSQTSKQDLGISQAEWLCYYEKYGTKLMSGDAYEKTKRMVKAGLGLDEWAKMKSSTDTDGNGGTTKAELTAYIEAHFDRERWHDLFAAYAGAGENAWNNPY